MKIAMMTNNFLPFIGGVPISIQRLSEGLRREGHAVSDFVFVLVGEGPEEKHLRRLAAEYYQTAAGAHRDTGTVLMKNSYYTK